MQIRKVPTQVVEANETDAIGQDWQITINTASYRDDADTFQPIREFSVLVNCGDQISQTLAAAHRKIRASINPLKAAVVVVPVWLHRSWR